MKPARLPGVVSRDLPDGETAIMSVENDQVVLLNAIGGIVWELCDGTRDSVEMAQIIAERFDDLSAAQIRADIEAMVQRLHQAGMLEA